MTKTEKPVRTELQENFPDLLDAALFKRFGVRFETFYDIFGCERHVTRRKDRKKLTQQQCQFIAGFMAAVEAAP